MGVAVVFSLSCMLAAAPLESPVALADQGLAGGFAGALADAQSDVTAGGIEEIDPGVYTVPVALKKANNHEQPSGAAAAIANEARLSVGSDGVATLTVETKPVTMGSLTGYASQYEVYQGATTASEAQPVTVLEYGTTEEGVQLVDSAGNPVPSKISFKIPAASAGGVYLKMFVDAMGSSPDAWLSIDYEKRVLEGSPVTYAGTAHVDQSGGYDVNARVSVLGGIIQGVKIEGANFASEQAEAEESGKLAEAVEEMQHNWDGLWIGHGHSNAEALYKAGGVDSDAGSGDAYMRAAIRDAVMNALGISWTDEVINLPKGPLEAGTYSVNVSYYTDIVFHQLAGGEKAAASLRVAKDGSMQLDVDLQNGTAREPLYTMNVNGCYQDNDASKGLVSTGLKTTKAASGYSDLYFPAGTLVVTRLSMPLLGGFAREYATQVYLYVPAMNALSGDQNGIVFDHGRLNVNAYLKVYWDSAKLVKSLAEEEAEKAAVERAAAEKAAAEKAKAEKEAAEKAAAERRVAADNKAVESLRITGVKKAISKKYQAKAFSLGAKASYTKAKLTYASSNKKVASVSKTGKVKVKVPGVAVITIRAKAKSASGLTKTVSLKTTVKVVLAKPSLTKATKSKKAGKVTAAWKKVAGAQGYQVKVTASGKSKVATVKSGKALEKTMSVAKGKKAKVQVRAYSKASGKIVYSAWSAAKTVKVRAR